MRHSLSDNWLGWSLSFIIQVRKPAEARCQAPGTQDHEFGDMLKYFRRESHWKPDSSWGNDMEKSLKKTSQNKWSTYCWKMSSDRSQFQSSEFTARWGLFLQFLVSCFTNNKRLSTLPVKYNKAIFAVINPHGHDKSKHAKRLTPQLPDTWGTKSDYELYATINRARCFIKQFIVHKNDKTYLSDRTWSAVPWAAWWKKGQRCLFNILTSKLRGQSALKKTRVTHIFDMWPNITSKLQATQ